MPIIIGKREELKEAYTIPMTQRQSRTYKWFKFKHSEVKNMGIKMVKELIKEISSELGKKLKTKSCLSYSKAKKSEKRL